MSSTNTESDLAAAPLHVSGDLSIRLLALQLGANGDETYRVSFRRAPGTAFRTGRMTHAGGALWDLVDDDSTGRTGVTLGSPDEVFRLALGARHDAQRALAAEVAKAAPLWPTSLTLRLAGRRLSGYGTVAFDARWFLAELATSAFDRPLLFPGATSKLRLVGLDWANAVVRALVGLGDVDLVEALLRALDTEQVSDGVLDWDGEGRLIGELTTGALAQIGTDVREGCQRAIGFGPLEVVFEPSEPLGLGLGPLSFTNDERGEVGMGVVVGEVDEGGAAERAGVTEGMVLARLSGPDCVVAENGRSRMPFDAALDEIDARRAAGRALAVTFDTAAPVTHIYAVEMPAAAALAALALAGGVLAPPPPVGVGAALNSMCRGALLWREDTPRLFIGEPGSLTCAHTDICPQLEIAHGLWGIKLLGVASHDATPRLIAEHASDDSDEDATLLPTDRPLTSRQSRLLGEPDVTLALLREGDLAIFDSGALHFASNGAEGLSAAMYHGAITPAAIPRLRIAAKVAASRDRSEGAYRHHLYADDLLREVEPLLALFHAAAGDDAG